MLAHQPLLSHQAAVHSQYWLVMLVPLCCVPFPMAYLLHAVCFLAFPYTLLCMSFSRECVCMALLLTHSDLSAFLCDACHSWLMTVSMCRDLKPENFLLSNKDPNAPLKATDFGLSVFYHPGQVFTDIVGSAYYVAPEVTPSCALLRSCLHSLAARLVCKDSSSVKHDSQASKELAIGKGSCIQQAIVAVPSQ